MIPGAAYGAVEVRQTAGHDPRVFDHGPGNRYVLLIYGDESRSVPSSDAIDDDVVAGHWRFIDEMTARGAYCVADALLPSAGSVTVRVREGKTVRTDGPFAETKEQLAGFYELQLADLDDALATTKHFMAISQSHCVEVRPVARFG